MGTRGHGPLFVVLVSPRRLAPVFTPSLLQPRFLNQSPAVLSRPRRAHGPRWHRDGDSGVLGGSDSAPGLTLAPSRISKALQVSVSQPSAPRARSRIRRPATPGVPAVLGMSPAPAPWMGAGAGCGHPAGPFGTPGHAVPKPSRIVATGTWHGQLITPSHPGEAARLISQLLALRRGSGQPGRGSEHPI